jgi:hypothetical protein
MPGLPERAAREHEYLASMQDTSVASTPRSITDLKTDLEKLYGPLPSHTDPVFRAIRRHDYGVVRTKGPAGVFVLAGPSGSGKTFFAQSLGEALHGRKVDNCLLLNGGDYETDTSVLKILGAPPTYMGHRETPPIFSPKSMGDVRSKHSSLAVIIWDEIERMNRRVRNLFLSIMDENNGTINLGDNTPVSFRNTLHLITTNLGSGEYETAGNYGLADSRVNLSGGLRRRERIVTLLENKLDRAIMKRISRLGGVIEFPKLSPAAVESIVWRKVHTSIAAFNDSPIIPQKAIKTIISPLWVRDFMAKYDFGKGIREGLAGLTVEVTDLLLDVLENTNFPEGHQYYRVRLERVGEVVIETTDTLPKKEE